MSRCGDSVVNPAVDEQCDDGNMIRSDGCEPDCTFTCLQNSECSDGLECNGSETCENHLCLAGTALASGQTCMIGSTSTMGVCRRVDCVPAGCGNSVIDNAMEECDDGNMQDGDGCDTDCTFSCGDGYAAPGATSQQACSMPRTAPCASGTWTTRVPIAGNLTTIDCNDSSANAYPGQTAYFCSPLAGRRPPPTTTTLGVKG